MKFFYSLLLLNAACLSLNAQSLNPGQVTENVYNRPLLVQEFSLVNSTSSSKETQFVAPANISGHREINFSINYSAGRHTFSGSLDPDSIWNKSSASFNIKPISHFSPDAGDNELRNINFMQLKISLGGDNTALTISNLKLNGTDITGSYTANTSGDIYWHLIYGEFGSDFTITGTINVVNNIVPLDAESKMEIAFGSSRNLSPAALSVYWGEVNAGEKNRANIINWNTNKEENNDRFIIERATDGLTFTGIGLVTGAGNRTIASSYSFTDKDFTEANNYYRIKQVDMDGHASYSVVVHIVNNNAVSKGQENNNVVVSNNIKSNKETVSGLQTKNAEPNK